jgi:hypothetical protein
MLSKSSSIIIALTVIAVLTTSFLSVSAIDLNFSGDTTNKFAQNLKSEIKNLISNALNDTHTILNSSFITNGSNLTSSNVMISNNNVASIVSSNGSKDSSSLIKDQIKTINGVCNSIKVGGNGNDTLASSGKCNDELTGGPGADKFMCGDGNDTIKDYNSKEGDIILDKQNCEKILS